MPPKGVGKNKGKASKDKGSKSKASNEGAKDIEDAGQSAILTTEPDVETDVQPIPSLLANVAEALQTNKTVPIMVFTAPIGAELTETQMDTQPEPQSEPQDDVSRLQRLHSETPTEVDPFEEKDGCKLLRLPSDTPTVADNSEESLEAAESEAEHLGFTTPHKQIVVRVGSAGRFAKTHDSPLPPSDVESSLKTPRNADEDFLYMTDEVDTSGKTLIIRRHTSVTCHEEYRSEEISLMYKLMRKATVDLSPGNHGDPIFGELTSTSNATVLSMLRTHCDFNKKSRFLDIGSGTGKMVQHAARFALLSGGLEVVEMRHKVALVALSSVLTFLKDRRHPACFVHGDALKLTTMDPYTHIYMFCRGFPEENYAPLGSAFNASVSACYLVCCRPPEFIKKYFHVDIVHEISNTSMRGSGQGIRFFFYKRCELHRRDKYHESCVEFLKDDNVALDGLEGKDPFADPLLAAASRQAFCKNDDKLSALQKWIASWQCSKVTRSSELTEVPYVDATKDDTLWAETSTSSNELLANTMLPDAATSDLASDAIFDETDCDVHSVKMHDEDGLLDVNTFQALKNAVGQHYLSLITPGGKEVEKAAFRLVQSAVAVKNAGDQFQLQAIEFTLLTVNAFKMNKSNSVPLLKAINNMFVDVLDRTVSRSIAQECKAKDAEYLCYYYHRRNVANVSNVVRYSVQHPGPDTMLYEELKLSEKSQVLHNDMKKLAMMTTEESAVTGDSARKEAMEKFYTETSLRVKNIRSSMHKMGWSAWASAIFHLYKCYLYVTYAYTSKKSRNRGAASTWDVRKQTDFNCLSEYDRSICKQHCDDLPKLAENMLILGDDDMYRLLAAAVNTPKGNKLKPPNTVPTDEELPDLGEKYEQRRKLRPGIQVDYSKMDAPVASKRKIQSKDDVSTTSAAKKTKTTVQKELQGASIPPVALKDVANAVGLTGSSTDQVNNDQVNNTIVETVNACTYGTSGDFNWDSGPACCGEEEPNSTTGQQLMDVVVTNAVECTGDSACSTVNSETPVVQLTISEGTDGKLACWEGILTGPNTESCDGRVLEKETGSETAAEEGFMIDKELCAVDVDAAVLPEVGVQPEEREEITGAADSGYGSGASGSMLEEERLDELQPDFGCANPLDYIRHCSVLDQKWTAGQIDRILLEKEATIEVAEHVNLRSFNTVYKPKSWLSDEVINKIMALLNQREDMLRDTMAFPNRTDAAHGSNYFFHSFLFAKLYADNNEYNFEAVQKYAKRVNLFRKGKVFFPLNNDQSHWNLVVLDISKKCATIYDSLVGRPLLVKYMEYLVDYIYDDAVFKNLMDRQTADEERKGWFYQQPEDGVPQQQNSYDCGVFTVMYAMYLSEDLPLSFSQGDMPEFRSLLIYLMLRGRIPDKRYPLSASTTSTPAASSGSSKPKSVPMPMSNCTDLTADSQEESKGSIETKVEQLLGIVENAVAYKDKKYPKRKKLSSHMISHLEYEHYLKRIQDLENALKSVEAIIR